jgi:hypothetical protein
MAIIDVLIVVDAPRIISDYGRNDGASTGKYVMIGPNDEGQGYVYMVTTWKDAQGEGTSNLHVFAQKGDIIRWRMTSMSMSSRFQCFLTHFVINNGGSFITAPQAKHQKVNSSHIDPNSPGLNVVVPSQIDDFFWESTVLAQQHVTYHTQFCICGDECGGGGGGGESESEGGGGGGGSCSGGGNCGGYQWDPFIN